MEAVYLGVPSYDGSMDRGAASGSTTRATRKRPIRYFINDNSLLCFNCNVLWADALLERAKSCVKWFAMLHADIDPASYWVDDLIEQAELANADVMSAVVPIKDARGLTSTALENPDDPWMPFTRLTTTQLNHPTFPRTFDASALRKWMTDEAPEGCRVRDIPANARLQVNTGCMVARIDRPWAEQIRFHIEDRILRLPDGWAAQVQPEDWLFSRDVAALGGRVFATKVVQTIHMSGRIKFPSTDMWGMGWDYQSEDARESVKVKDDQATT